MVSVGGHHFDPHVIRIPSKQDQTIETILPGPYAQRPPRPDSTCMWGWGALELGKDKGRSAGGMHSLISCHRPRLHYVSPPPCRLDTLMATLQVMRDAGSEGQPSPLSTHLAGSGPALEHWGLSVKPRLSTLK